MDGARQVHDFLENFTIVKQKPHLSSLVIKSLTGVDDEEDLCLDLSYSTAYRKLTSYIFEEYAKEENTGVISETSPYLSAYEGTKPIPHSLRLNEAVTSRLAIMDKALEAKKNQPKPSPSFPLFMKIGSVNYYSTGDPPDTKVSANHLGVFTPMLDGNRTKFLDSSKVAFSMGEMENMYKAIFRQLEIWSYATSSFKVMADGFGKIKEQAPENLKPLVDEYASFIKCLDKAGRHGIGEASNLLGNLMLKKREHVLNMSHWNVEQCQKMDHLYAPISDFKLFYMERVKESVK